MRASLGPVLANVIMAECYKVTADDLVKEGTKTFNVRYVDDTSLLLKRQEIDKVLKEFNEFNKNLKFTLDKLEI